MSAARHESHELRRREFLAGACCAAAGAAVGCSRPRLAATSVSSVGPPNESAILVLVELVGGCDPLSVIVPRRDDHYFRARPTIAIAPDEVLRIDDEHGFHPSLANLRSLYDRGLVACVQGAGYPDPYYSHFRSQEVWHTARTAGRASGNGWIGRLREQWREPPGRDLVVHVGSEPPYSLHSESCPPLAFQTPETLQRLGERSTQTSIEKAGAMEHADERLGAGASTVLASMRQRMSAAGASTDRVLRAVERHRPVVEYPETPFAASLRSIAALIAGEFGARVYSIAHGNFDSHGETMRQTYAQNLRAFDGGLTAFLADLEATSTKSEVLVLAFTEFGRRIAENQSLGTDHGGASAMLLVGSRVEPGLHGVRPSLAELDENGNAVYTTDFRSVYATILARHFGVAPESVLGETWPVLPILRA